MKNNYLDNKKFLASLTKYKEDVDFAEKNGLSKPRIPEYIGECFYKLANNLSKRPNFCLYTYKDEMVSDAVENCIMYIDNFDPTNKKQNPFGYFTKTCWYAFIRRIAKEKKQQYIKYKATENFGVLDEEELLELDDGTISQIQMYDNLYEFIEQYENAVKENKKKAAIKKKKGIENFIDGE